MKCNESRDLFAEALYGELDDLRTAELNAHLASCAACSREFGGLKQTLAVMSGRTRQEPDESEWREIMEKIEGKLAAEPRRGARPDGAPEKVIPLRPANGLPGISGAGEPSRSARPFDADRTGGEGHPRRPAIIPRLPFLRPVWVYGIAAVLLVAFGVFMGRMFFSGGGGEVVSPGGSETLTSRTPEIFPGRPADTAAGRTTESGSSAVDSAGLPGRTAPGVSTETAGPGSRGSNTARKPAPPAPVYASAEKTDREALAFLERSRNLLLGVTNIDESRATPVTLAREQQVSRELYDRGNTLAVALTRPSQQQVRQLIQSLQVILLQLANMDIGNGKPAVELIRQGVTTKSILLKINLEAIRAGLSEDRDGSSGDQNRKKL